MWAPHGATVQSTKRHTVMFRLGLQVPKDAWELDLVFSDSGLGGSGHFYDNNGGFDYHVPLRGSLHPQPRLSIVHVAVEMAPIAKVGAPTACHLDLCRRPLTGRILHHSLHLDSVRSKLA